MASGLPSGTPGHASLSTRPDKIGNRCDDFDPIDYYAEVPKRPPRMAGWAYRHQSLPNTRGGARPDKIGNRRDDFGPLDYYALDSAGGFVYWHQAEPSGAQCVASVPALPRRPRAATRSVCASTGLAFPRARKTLRR